MHIKAFINKGANTLAGAIFVLLFSSTAFSQINETSNPEVFTFLSRMAEKGLITWKDYQLPLDRKSIFNALEQLRTDSSGKLSKVEEKEIRFYLKDFAFDAPAVDSSETANVFLFKKDSVGRFRTLSVAQKNFKLFVDPLVGVDFLQSSGKHNTTYFAGARVAGYLGNHFGFNFSFRDITEKGDSINTLKSFTPQQGIVRSAQTSTSISYSDLRFNVGYRWKNGVLNFGKDNLVYGYGKGGNVILSGKAPSFPYLSLNLQPWKWLHFNYFHGWLMSDIIDSNRTYNTGSGLAGNRRVIYRSKFIASHSVTVTPLKGLDISLGESIVYSDKINFAYLIPVNFFKAYDHYTSQQDIAAGSNGQFFGFISSRNHIKNTHLYAQFFIDEIKLSTIFDKTQKRNQIAYTFGFEKTDFFTNYLTLGAEYSRVNPFVYNNLIPTQTYASHSYSLGDWMGNNADRVYAYLRYTPLPKLRLMTWIQNIRKGPAGTLQQQYNQQPQPVFLSQQLFSFKEVGATVSYEWLNTSRIFLKINRVNWDYPTRSYNSSGFNLGLSYGL